MTCAGAATVSVGERLDWLDGMRAYAIALVVLTHSFSGVSGLPDPFRVAFALGAYGVQLFFVISAATIYLTLARGGSLAAWGLRRFFRIAPLYYAGIIFYGLWRVVLPDDSEPTLLQWVAASGANALFLHGWIPPAINSIVPGGWSIAAEMTFYALAPWLIRYLRRRESGAVRVIALAVAILVAVQSLFGFTTYGYFFYWPPSHLPVFFVALLAVHRLAPSLLEGATLPVNARLSAPVIFAVALAAGTLLHIRDVQPLAILSFGIAFVALMILAREPWRSAFQNRVAVSIGRVSYSMYVTHFAVMRVVRGNPFVQDALEQSPLSTGTIVFLVALAASYGISLATYRWIERPGIELGRRVSRRLAT